MAVSWYGEGYVMMWGYFNSKGLGDFIRMHSILDPLNNWPLKIKICLPLWEFNKKIGDIEGWIFPHLFI